MQKAVEVRDAHGQPVKSWQTMATVPAGVEPLRGKEMESASQVTAEQITRVVLRYRPDIDADWRIVFGDHVFDIVAPPRNIDSRNKELHVMCREIT
ncbi:MAG: phage head closure protein [bacterium]|nr:phage head closure protein [bacterium]